MLCVMKDILYVLLIHKMLTLAATLGLASSSTTTLPEFDFPQEDAGAAAHLHHKCSCLLFSAPHFTSVLVGGGFLHPDWLFSSPLEQPLYSFWFIVKLDIHRTLAMDEANAFLEGAQPPPLLQALQAGVFPLSPAGSSAGVL